MNAYSNVIELSLDNHGKKVIKKIYFDMYNGEEELISVFTPEGKRIEREEIGTYDPAEYHINVDKVFEKYYVEREELDDLEKIIAMIYFRKKDDLKAIAGTNKDLLEILKEHEKISQYEDVTS